MCLCVCATATRCAAAPRRARAGCRCPLAIEACETAAGSTAAAAPASRTGRRCAASGWAAAAVPALPPPPPSRLPPTPPAEPRALQQARHVCPCQDVGGMDMCHTQLDKRSPHLAARSLSACAPSATRARVPAASGARVSGRQAPRTRTWDDMAPRLRALRVSDTAMCSGHAMRPGEHASLACWLLTLRSRSCRRLGPCGGRRRGRSGTRCTPAGVPPCCLRRG